MKHTLSSLKVEEGGLLQTLEENQNILASYSKDKEELKAKHDRVARQVRPHLVCIVRHRRGRISNITRDRE